MLYDPKIIYLSGKMSGIKDYGFSKFHDAAQHLRDLGFVVISPPELAGGTHIKNLKRSKLLRCDFALLSEANLIVLLPDWTESKGAKAELIVATEIGLPAYLYSEDDGIGVMVNAKDWRVEWTMQADGGSRHRSLCQSS